MFAHFRKAARALLPAGLLPLVVAGCVTTDGVGLADTGAARPTHYAAIRTEKFAVDAVDLSAIDLRLLRQVVDYRSAEPPGTVVVDPHNRYLYLVERGGKAVRYGVGVGRAAMIAREPKRYAKWAGGMDGGEGNPLGARALYLFKDGRDTRFRIHGTTEPDSIGKAVSSGCIRMMNQDIIDLYGRVPLHARVVVL